MRGTRLAAAAAATLLLATVDAPSPAAAAPPPAAAAFPPASAASPLASCPDLTAFNLLSLGDAELANTEVQGPLGVAANARLAAFSVNHVTACAPRSIALAVGGTLNATGGMVSNGQVVVGGGGGGGRGRRWGGGGGRRPLLPRTVGRECAPDGPPGALPDFKRLARTARAVHGLLCAAPAAGCMTVITPDRRVEFRVSPSAAHREEAVVCRVLSADITAATSVEVVGRGRPSRRVAILVDGSRGVAGGAIGGVGSDSRAVALAHKGFFGFLPTTTVLAFCGVPTLAIDNVGVPAAVLAPRTHLRSTYGHIEGTVIVASARGGVEFRHAPLQC